MAENELVPVVQTGPLVMRGEMDSGQLRARVEDFVERIKLMDEVVDRLMEEGDGKDYGIIPGVKKPSLFQAGADKLNAFFGYAPEFEVAHRDLDKASGLYFVTYRCRLIHRETGVKVGEGIGSANNREVKYYYRQGERVCPKCKQPTIKRSKYPPRGTNDEPGWYCFGKIGGCGENFAAADPAIVDQQTGKVVNPDLADTINTIDKMAQKRAKVAAVLNVTGLTRKYTQDVEDGPRQHDDTGDRGNPYPEDESPPQASQDAENGKKPVMLDKTSRELFAVKVEEITPDTKDKDRAALIAKVGKDTIPGYNDWRYLTIDQLDPLLAAIKTEVERQATGAAILERGRQGDK